MTPLREGKSAVPESEATATEQRDGLVSAADLHIAHAEQSARNLAGVFTGAGLAEAARGRVLDAASATAALARVAAAEHAGHRLATGAARTATAGAAVAVGRIAATHVATAATVHRVRVGVDAGTAAARLAVAATHTGAGTHAHAAHAGLAFSALDTHAAAVVAVEVEVGANQHARVIGHAALSRRALDVVAAQALGRSATTRLRTASARSVGVARKAAAVAVQEAGVGARVERTHRTFDVHTAAATAPLRGATARRAHAGAGVDAGCVDATAVGAAAAHARGAGATATRNPTTVAMVGVVVDVDAGAVTAEQTGRARRVTSARHGSVVIATTGEQADQRQSEKRNAEVRHRSSGGIALRHPHTVLQTTGHAQSGQRCTTTVPS